MFNDDGVWVAEFSADYVPNGVIARRSWVKVDGKTVNGQDVYQAQVSLNKEVNGTDLSSVKRIIKVSGNFKNINLMSVSKVSD